MNKAVVLLSGGQDSTTSLFWAKHFGRGMGKPIFDEVHALTLLYGQRHAIEVKAAAEIATLARVTSHRVMTLPVLGGSALTDTTKQISGEGGMVDHAMPQGLPTSFVPGRNLVFLSVAAAYAASIGAETIVTGVCQTDYSGYPDCRQDFIDAMVKAIGEAMPSSLDIKIRTPLMKMTKAETVEMLKGIAVETARLEGIQREADARIAANKGVAYSIIPEAKWDQMPEWQALGKSITCYNGLWPGCGTCPACELRAKGFAEVDVKDPSRHPWGA